MTAPFKALERECLTVKQLIMKLEAFPKDSRVVFSAEFPGEQSLLILPAGHVRYSPEDKTTVIE